MMDRMRKVIAALLSFWTLLAVAFAQEDQDFTPPPPPADGILDEARILSRDPARHRAIAEAIAELEAKHGFRMYYALYDTLISSNAGDRALTLQRAWLGEKPGIVLVIETDRGTFRFEQAAPKDHTRARMIVLAIGLLAGTGLLALLVVAGLKRAESKAQERYVFPQVNVGMRLGAPYGGGKISSRSFREPPKG